MERSAYLGRGILTFCMVDITACSALCGTPPPQAFTEEAAQRGVSYVVEQPADFGHGTLMCDLDGDGDVDIMLLGAADGTVGVFENTGGGVFNDRSALSGIGTQLCASGLAAADFDRDGDLDVYLSRVEEPNRLLRNDGGLAFTDITDEAGVGDGHWGTGCAWGDYDGDGWIDLYVSNWHDPNRLYRNLGDGTFEDVAPALGVDRGDDPTFQTVFFDYDRDGDADLYVANDKGQFCATFRNHLFRNDGGVFTEVTDESNTEACVLSMCAAIGDFDRNLYQDIYCTNIAQGNALLMNNGDGTFDQSEVDAGVESFAIGWGSVFFDFDNDTWTDLYVANILLENRLYRHTGTWPSVDLAPLCGVDVASYTFCVAVGDIDDDGDLDLILQDRQAAIMLFINHEGELRHWAKYDVVGEDGDRYAVGARIDVRTGDTWQTREVIAGCNYKSQNQLVRHFGLGGATHVDELRVTWPRGAERSLTTLAADTTWTLYPPDRLGDADGDGARTLVDFQHMAGCYTGDAPGSLVPGCEMMDYEGDGDVDLADGELFLADYRAVIDDCNDNGVADLLEILSGESPDLDGDGVIDDCAAVPGDVTGDGVVDVSDLLVVLSTWGPCPNPCNTCSADLDDDCTVGVTDLLTVLAGWS